MTDNTITVATVSASRLNFERVHKMIDLLLNAAIEQSAPRDTVAFDVSLRVRIERAIPPAPDTQEATTP